MPAIHKKIFQKQIPKKLTKNKIKKYRLIVLSLLIGLIILSLFYTYIKFIYIPIFPSLDQEGYIHTLYPPNSTMHEPEVKKNGIHLTSHINSYGFRDYEYTIKKKTNTFRIVFLGDSFVYGYANELKDTIPKQLEKKLNGLNHSVIYEVLNFGFKGLSLEQYVKVLKKHAIRFEPDLIIIGYLYNDHVTSISYKKEYQDKFFIRLAYFLSNNCISRKLRISNNFFTQKAFEYYEYKNQEENIFTENEISVYNNFKEIVLLAESINGDVVVFTFPMDSYTPNMLSWLKYSSNHLGFKLIILPPIEDVEKFYVSPFDHHFNVAGNEIIAQRIFEYLINNSYFY